MITKTSTANTIRKHLQTGLLLLAAFLFTGPNARAGLSFELHLIRFAHGTAYRFFTPLDTNSVAPAAALGTYLISSPFYSATQTTNGSWRAIQITAGGANTVGGTENAYPDFKSFMNQITNGPWTIEFTNSTTTNFYNFTVSAPTMTSNMLPATIITSPANVALNVPNLPTLTWQGPTGFPVPTVNSFIANYDFSFADFINVPAGQTSFTPSTPIPNGLDLNFNVDYVTNNTTPVFVISTPLNTNAPHGAISGWTPTSVLDTGDAISFAVTNPPSPTTTLIAHYAFENSNNLGEDSSGNGYDLDFNGGNGVTATNDANVGSSAAYFDGSSFFTYNSAPSAVLSALAGDFSISFWIKTTQDDGNEDDEAWAGAGIVAADIPGQDYDIIPAALDGGEIGFNTGPNDDTINSTIDINNINSVNHGYHHVVVTRNGATGEKKIYIDGVLNISDFATLNPLSDPHQMAVGCAIDASQFDPNNVNPGQFFQGQLDDLQIYSGVLSSSQVSQLYANAGSSSTLVAHYAFDNGGNIGLDTSGNGYDLDFNGGNGVTASGDTKTGNGAAYFDGSSFLSYSSTPSAVLNAFAGNFTLSFWIKTSQTNGNENGPAWAGAGIVAADIPQQFNDSVPAALDGGEIGFNTGPNDDTLNSLANINQGTVYHHVAVTRDQSTGLKQIYIDGVLNNSDTDNTGLLNDPVLVAVGCGIDASQSDPNNADPHQFFQGLLDDLQIYSQVLSATDIAFLNANPGSTVNTGSGAGHQNFAHFTFDDANNPGHDSSGNGNDMSGITYWGPTNQFSSDAIAGGGAARFFGGSAMTANGQTLPNLDALLAGSFSFSVWVKTAVSINSDTSDAFHGGVIFWAYNDHSNINDTIPLSITGSKVAFSTRDSNGFSDTLHSTSGVNDGVYHLLTVTRDGATGEKKIYVDGNFQTSDIATTDPLNGNNYFLSIGGYAYFVDGTGTNFSAYNGLLDDLQIYSGVLSAGDVTYIYNHPGVTVPDVSGEDFNAALNTTGQSWSTGGDASWFVETTTTHDGVSAAQSGAIGDGLASHLDTTVPANGQVSFYWKVSSEATFDFLHFYINGNEQDAISGNVDWNQETYSVSSGDVLRWEYTKDDGCCSNGLDAGFLDQVTFSAVPVTITVNPFDQTNHPGYNVALLAAATGNPPPTFQWYKVGPGLIPGATNGLYIPTNSGNASVAGNYYAIATAGSGSAITTTAAVTFVSATLPPDWSIAFKSAFLAVDDTKPTLDFYYGCIVDANSNIYTAADYGGAMTVGSQTFISGTNGDAAAVVKQSPTGTPIWGAAITNNGVGNGRSSALSVAPAPGGGVYLAGNYSGTNNWLGTNKLVDAGGGDIFIARFNATGSNVWVKTFGGPGSDFMIINSLASDSSGNVTLCGLLGAGPVTIGSSNYTVVGQEGVILQLDQTGTARWSQLLSSEFPQYLAYDAGRLYVSVTTATNAGTTNVVIGGVSNPTDRAWAVACLNNTNGLAFWVRGVGGRYGAAVGDPYASGLQDDVPRIAVAGTNVFLTGVAYDSTAQFGGLTVNFTLPRGQYFARYDTNGNPKIATSYGSVTTAPSAAVANTNGNVYVSGNFDTYSIFGSNMIAAPAYTKITAGGFSQSFIAKFDLNGNPLWAREAVSPAVVNFLGLALASDGVWASGWGWSSNLTHFQPIAFGTNFVRTDEWDLVGGAGGSTFVIYNPGGVLGKITETAGVALPVTLLSPQNSGTNFQFSFLSQAGRQHFIQGNTNLILGSWIDMSNFTGDGTVWQFTFPRTNPPPAHFFRIRTQ